jgi:hypothetical protein
MDGVAGAQQRFHPRHKLVRGKAPRRLGQQVIVLGDNHVELGMDVQPELDHRAGEFNVVTGDRECGRPFVMNDCIMHIGG